MVAGIKQLAPHLIGADASLINSINAIMDKNLKGHPYVKAPVDMACWDALGKLTKQPLSTLLGGKLRDSVIMYKAVPQRSPEVMGDLMLKFRKQVMDCQELLKNIW